MRYHQRSQDLLRKFRPKLPVQKAEIMIWAMFKLNSKGAKIEHWRTLDLMSKDRDVTVHTLIGLRLSVYIKRSTNITLLGRPTLAAIYHMQSRLTL